jgi:pyridoxal phosphate enzyme (YggS family)
VDDIRANLETIRQRIAAAAARVGRDPSTVNLVAVSKTVPPAGIEEALGAGQLLFGESKIQEAKVKAPVLSSRVCWHMVGHLQSNKARDAVALFELIHSVDSVKLAAEIAHWAERAGQTQRVLLEVNVSGETSKFGLAPAVVPATLAALYALPRLQVDGLMTIPPAGKDARPFFRQLRELRDRLGLRELSMGMTHDYEVAVEEGATLVRIGTGIFGDRGFTGRTACGILPTLP